MTPNTKSSEQTTRRNQ